MSVVVITGWRLILYGADNSPGIMEAMMAQRVTVELEDDLDGGPADETLRFGLGGTDYEIDLSKKNASRFRRQIAPYIEHARKAARGQRHRPTRSSSALWCGKRCMML